MDINQFHIAGINFRKTDLSSRGRFAFSKEQYEAFCKQGLPPAFKEFFIVSTCNRTEIYAVSQSASDITQWLISQCRHVSGMLDQMYIKSGDEAVSHLLEVAAGLDSQLLGDCEITGQIKQSFKIAKEHNLTGPFLERLVNTALQCSKQIRNQTRLSSGTVSVAFAALQYLRHQGGSLRNKKILIAGAGKMGRNTCKNLLDYTNARNITLINRTEDVAASFSKENNLKHLPWESLQQAVADADIIIVATHAAAPVITCDMIPDGLSKILIDLSVPANIDPALERQRGIWLMNVDRLSRVNDETLTIRQACIPQARSIVAENQVDFKEWLKHRRNVPVIKATRQRLETMHNCPLFLQSVTTAADPHQENIQQVVNTMAAGMRTTTAPGCFFIKAINDYITLIA